MAWTSAHAVPPSVPSLPILLSTQRNRQCDASPSAYVADGAPAVPSSRRLFVWPLPAVSVSWLVGKLTSSGNVQSASWQSVSWPVTLVAMDSDAHWLWVKCTRNVAKQILKGEISPPSLLSIANVFRISAEIVTDSRHNDRSGRYTIHIQFNTLCLH